MLRETQEQTLELFSLYGSLHGTAPPANHENPSALTCLLQERDVPAHYATGKEWRSSFRKNEEAETKGKNIQLWT